jgi:hypothetical protein
MVVRQAVVQELLGDLGDSQPLEVAGGKLATLLDEPLAVSNVGLGFRFSEALLLVAGDLEILGLLVFAVPGFRQHERALRILADPKGSVSPGEGDGLTGAAYCPFTALRRA